MCLSGYVVRAIDMHLIKETYLLIYLQIQWPSVYSDVLRDSDSALRSGHRFAVKESSK